MHYLEIPWSQSMRQIFATSSIHPVPFARRWLADPPPQKPSYFVLCKRNKKRNSKQVNTLLLIYKKLWECQLSLVCLEFPDSPICVSSLIPHPSLSRVSLLQSGSKNRPPILLSRSGNDLSNTVVGELVDGAAGNAGDDIVGGNAGNVGTESSRSAAALEG